MKNKISVIVPVFNQELFIRRCLDSLANQTYKNMEIIIVNDGSTDNSAKICDEYKSKDGRFTVIHKENEGVGAARNDGLLIATGEYIFFVDSDDYLIRDALEILCIKAAKSDADITISNHVYFDEKGHCLKNDAYEVSTINAGGVMGKSIIFKYFCGKSLGLQVWNKLYKVSFIKEKKVLFDKDLRYPEDFLFSFKLFVHNPKVSLINNYTYYYLQHGESITNRYKEGLTENYIQLAARLKEYLVEQKKEDEYDSILAYRSFSSIDASGRNVYNYSTQKFKDMRCELKKFKKCHITNEYIGRLAKFKYLKAVPRNDWKYYAWVFSLAYSLNLISLAALMHIARFKIKDRHGKEWYFWKSD